MLILRRNWTARTVLTTSIVGESRSRNLLLLLLALLASVSVVPRAAAEPRKHVAVLSLESDMVTDDVAKGLRQAVCDALTARSDWEVHETQVSLAQLSFAHDCTPTEPECLRSITKQFQLDSLVFGRISRHEDEIRVHLSRFDPQASAVERTADAKFAGSSATPEGLASQGRALTGDLFDARPLTVAAQEEAKEGEISEQETLQIGGTSAPVAATASDHGVSGRTVAGYALLGTAAVSVGLSVFSFVQIQNAQDDAGFVAYRRAVGRMQPNVQDVCDEVDSGKRYGLSGADFERSQISCNRGHTYQLLQFVFLGSALITGGLGAYLLLGESNERDRDRKRALTLQPKFSRTSAELAAQLRF